MKTSGEGKTSDGLRSVGIALDIIDALAEESELGVSELARRVGIAKSTAHRTCSVLTARGLLDRTTAGEYRLGLRFVEFGGLATKRTAVRDRGLPLLVELRNTLGETVQIGVPASPFLTINWRYSSARRKQMPQSPGSRSGDVLPP